MANSKWMITKEYKETCIAIMQENMAPLRAKAGITQDELSNVIGCSRQTYYAIENNQRVLSWSNFLLLSFFYHELKATKSMIEELKIYPVELFAKFNDEVRVVL